MIDQSLPRQVLTTLSGKDSLLQHNLEKELKESKDVSEREKSTIEELVKNVKLAQQNDNHQELEEIIKKLEEKVAQVIQSKASQTK